VGSSTKDNSYLADSAAAVLRTFGETGVRPAVERRCFKRASCSLEARCGAEGGEFRGRVTDISAGGAYVMLDRNCHWPDKLYMTFVVPGPAGDKQVKAIGNVVRTYESNGDEGRGFGVSFVVVQQESRQAIVDFVDGVSLAKSLVRKAARVRRG
jgi:c-di-GMP-binding flagellar brake protein YcgR